MKVPFTLKPSRRFVSVKNKMLFFFLLAILIPVVILFVNSYISSQQMLERKYTDLLADVTRQSNIRIEEFLEDTKQISLIASYGINSYISAVSQENYPVQNFLHDSSVTNELQATQLLMNYITMKDRAISIYVYNLVNGSDLYVAPNKPVDYTYTPVRRTGSPNFCVPTILRAICRPGWTGRPRRTTTGRSTICVKSSIWRTASC